MLDVIETLCAQSVLSRDEGRGLVGELLDNVQQKNQQSGFHSDRLVPCLFTLAPEAMSQVNSGGVPWIWEHLNGLATRITERERVDRWLKKVLEQLPESCFTAVDTDRAWEIIVWCGLSESAKVFLQKKPDAWAGGARVPLSLHLSHPTILPLFDSHINLLNPWRGAPLWKALSSGASEQSSRQILSDHINTWIDERCRKGTADRDMIRHSERRWLGLWKAAADNHRAFDWSVIEKAPGNLLRKHVLHQGVKCVAWMLPWKAQHPNAGKWGSLLTSSKTLCAELGDVGLVVKAVLAANSGEAIKKKGAKAYSSAKTIDWDSLPDRDRVAPELLEWMTVVKSQLDPVVVAQIERWLLHVEPAPGQPTERSRPRL